MLRSTYLSSNDLYILNKFPNCSPDQEVVDLTSRAARLVGRQSAICLTEHSVRKHHVGCITNLKNL